MGFLSDVFGSRPKVPTVKPLNLQAEQSKAITGNLSTLPQAESMVSSANQFSRDQITKMLASVIPGYEAMTGQASKNIQSELKGEIPTDVSDAVSRSAAARSLGGGYAGSGMSRNLVSRDLGLTSLDLTQRGLSSAESWIKMADAMYSPSMMNVSSMFITPAQQAAFSVEERNAQTQQQWLQNQVNAMPDPMVSGLTNVGLGFAKSALGGLGGLSFGGGESLDFTGDYSGLQSRGFAIPTY